MSRMNREIFSSRPPLIDKRPFFLYNRDAMKKPLHLHGTSSRNRRVTSISPKLYGTIGTAYSTRVICVTSIFSAEKAAFKGKEATA